MKSRTVFMLATLFAGMCLQIEALQLASKGLLPQGYFITTISCVMLYYWQKLNKHGVFPDDEL